MSDYQKHPLSLTVLLFLFTLSHFYLGAETTKKIPDPTSIKEFQFQNHKDSSKIKVKIFDNIIYLPVRINHSEPLSFILDTGASNQSAIDEGVARTLKLPFGESSSSGGAGSESVIMYKLGTVLFSLPDINFPNKKLFTLPLRRLTPFWGKTIDGLAGGNILSHVVFEIDYEGQRVYFHDPLKYSYKGKGIRVPLNILFQSPFVKAKISINGEKEIIEGLFLLDTGLRGMVFTVPFYKKHGLVEKCRRTVHNILGFGIGGVSKGIIGRVSSLSFGGIRFNQPVVSFTTDEKGALTSDMFAGVIGTSFLHRFRVIFDYYHQELILEKNRFFDNPFEYDMSGIYFITEGENFKTFKIFNILKDSPADKAGLQNGDTILTINGKSAQGYTMEDLKRLFKIQGKKIDLSIRRKGKILSFNFTLRRMI